MIKYDPEKKQIELVETFSWDSTVKGLIQAAKDHYKEALEEDELPEEDIDGVKNFLEWEPCEEDINDFMEQIADSMKNDVWESCFNADSSLRDALAHCIEYEFFFKCTTEAFPFPEDY